MQPKIKPFEPEHLNGFTSREGDGPEDIAIGLDVWRKFPGISFTAFDGERVIGCAGWIVIRPGVAYPWAIFRDEIGDRPLWLHRTTWKLGRNAIEKLGVETMEVHIEEAKPRNRQWAERFGFRLASPVERIFDRKGRSYIKYVAQVAQSMKRVA